jgi:microcystin-dependent protein
MSQIEAFAFGFAPKGWLPCNGQLLPINQYQALFALLGTTYGGNGTTNFQLPDLRARVAIGWGQGSTGTDYALGDTTGVENVTVLETNMPAGPHTHTLKASAATTGGTAAPGNTVVLSSGVAMTGTTPSAVPIYSTAAPTVAMASLSPVGGQPHTNIAPVLAINYCICISGLFPSRG